MLASQPQTALPRYLSMCIGAGQFKLADYQWTINCHHIVSDERHRNDIPHWSAYRPRRGFGLKPVRRLVVAWPSGRGPLEPAWAGNLCVSPISRERCVSTGSVITRDCCATRATDTFLGNYFCMWPGWPQLQVVSDFPVFPCECEKIKRLLLSRRTCSAFSFGARFRQQPCLAEVKYWSSKVLNIFDKLTLSERRKALFAHPLRVSLCHCQTSRDIQFMHDEFPKISIARISAKKKMPGHVRSGHQSVVVHSASEKFAIMLELEFFHGANSSFLGLHYSNSICTYVAYLRIFTPVTWGQARLVTFTSEAYGQILKCLLLLVNE